VSILRPLGKSRPLAWGLAIYAFNLAFLGRLDEAYEAGEEARAIARGLGDGVSLSVALGALGLATMMSGNIEKTEEYLKEAKALIEELGSSLIGLHILVGEGTLHVLMGDLEGAEAIYREADQGFQELEDRTQSIFTRSELAHTLRRQGYWSRTCGRTPAGMFCLYRHRTGRTRKGYSAVGGSPGDPGADEQSHQSPLAEGGF
jgi:ATP/maltotriose-dependent transcriptional regulator MalT